jgi:A/G-specific adenine glycosylase
VIVRDRKVLLCQRPPKGFSGGLWEFPNWRVKGEKHQHRKLAKWIKEETNLSVVVKDRIGIFEQAYSHFKLTLHAYECQALGGESSGRWVKIRDLRHFPMSRIHRRIARTISEDTKTRT